MGVYGNIEGWTQLHRWKVMRFISFLSICEGTVDFGTFEMSGRMSMILRIEISLKRNGYLKLNEKEQRKSFLKSFLRKCWPCLF